jgi:hypothetical protein
LRILGQPCEFYLLRPSRTASAWRWWAATRYYDESGTFSGAIHAACCTKGKAAATRSRTSRRPSSPTGACPLLPTNPPTNHQNRHAAPAPLSLARACACSDRPHPHPTVWVAFVELVLRSTTQVMAQPPNTPRPKLLWPDDGSNPSGGSKKKRKKKANRRMRCCHSALIFAVMHRESRYKWEQISAR